MKLLIVTQKVDQNDDVLGFFHEWIREFSKKWNKVIVIALKLGEYNFPSNVKILSLGKEKGLSKLSWLLNFYKYIWRERNNYEAVFVHMNPRYIPIGWPIWRIFGKIISFWYAHGHVPLMLRIADKLTDVAFASTPEGYRLKSRKLKIVGQGIDVENFKNSQRLHDENKPFKIVSVGRISPSKDYKTLINAVAEFKKTGMDNFLIEIAGQPATDADKSYLSNLQKKIVEKGLAERFKFIGPIPNKDLSIFLNTANLFVNMGHTGSLDKANLEAMACGLPVLTCNEAYENIFGEYKNLLMYQKKDFDELAKKIQHFITAPESEKQKIGEDLRLIVVKDHNLEGLINKITEILQSKI